VSLPELHLEDWRPTKDTLHLYSQIVGKIRLAMGRLRLGHLRIRGPVIRPGGAPRR
jgi:hypothetical protein